MNKQINTKKYGYAALVSFVAAAASFLVAFPILPIYRTYRPINSLTPIDYTAINFVITAVIFAAVGIILLFIWNLALSINRRKQK